MKYPRQAKTKTETAATRMPRMTKGKTVKNGRGKLKRRSHPMK